MEQDALVDARVKDHVGITADLEVNVQVDDVHDEVELIEVDHELQ